VLDIFLARPHDFHGPVHMMRDLDRASDTIGFEPAPEPTANRVIVDNDLVQR
jgi:hypothetical protein